ncbi:MAG: ABC-2 family transporter protein [Anaerolineae bacterium]|nr:ABC-2 family transporter protein [Anaerolineae bacterium]
MFPALRAYPRLLKANWALVIEYRAELIMWFLSGTFPFIMMGVWLNIAKNRSLNGFDENAFVAYYLAVAWVRRINFIWILHDIEDRIRTGELSPYLLRPLDYSHHIFAKVIASRAYNAIVIGVVVGIIVLLVPGQQFDLRPLNLLMFVVALGCGFVFEFLAQYIAGTLAFWTTQVQRIHDMWWFLKTLLGGFLVPMALLPPQVQAVAEWLPFQISIGLPAEILIGRASPERVGFGLLVSLVWIIVMFGLSRWLWHTGLRRYGAVGA